MKKNKIALMLSCILAVFILASCSSLSGTVSSDEVKTYNTNALTFEFKNMSDGAIQSFISSARGDKSKTEARNRISKENRANYQTEQEMLGKITKDFKESFNEALSEEGYSETAVDNARFVIEGMVEVIYGRNEYGQTWFYDVYITAWDRQNVPLDYGRSDLIRHEYVVEPAEELTTLDRWPEMSWSTHGEIHAENAEEAEAELIAQLTKEIENSFVDNFFQF